MRGWVSMGFILALFPWLALFAACSTAPDGGADSDRLVGTSWRLVGILSVDGRIDAPDERSKYSIAFEADGQVRVRVDCNRGEGSWSEPAPGQLRFGRLATTRMMCLSAGSLHDRFIRDLGAVRSYQIRDGRLYLLLKTGGDVYEFEPAPR